MPLQDYLIKRRNGVFNFDVFFTKIIYKMLLRGNLIIRLYMAIFLHGQNGNCYGISNLEFIQSNLRLFST